MVDKISYSDFSKIDLRVGEIKSVESHPNADNLFVLKVELGEESERTIVAGLKKFYSAEELVGKKAIFVVNLKPIFLRGVESNGMILVAENKNYLEGAILTTLKDIGCGSKVF